MNELNAHWIPTRSGNSLHCYFKDEVDAAIDELKTENESLLQQNRELCQALQVMYSKEEYDKQKAKADKVIALLTDKANYNEYAYKRKPEELADSCRFYEKELRHHKYKRCLTMAKWCDAMKSYFNESAFFDVYSNERMVFYERWHNRWLKIAEQFKDKEAK